jgi:hypothetical protein
VKPVIFSGIPTGAIMPGAVMAALDYLRFADSLRSPRSLFEGTPQESRDLDDREQMVYDAALDLLYGYFKGRLDIQNPQAAAPGGDDPEQPQPVPF